MAGELKVLRRDELREKVCIVVGTRPGIVMFAPIIEEVKKRGLPCFVLHTGQHYSPNMDAQFFEDLELAPPEHRLEGVAEKKTHGGQTAAMLEGIEDVLLEERPKIVLVGGDANTNLAGALAGRKLHIRVGHIEAGERSGDWRMPEEHNRIIIDHISEYLFTTNEKGKENLIRDNVRGEIFITGNPIVDAVFSHIEVAKRKSSMLEEMGVQSGRYFLLTLHREENVDVKEVLENVLRAMGAVYRKFGERIIFLAHPRTLKRLAQFGLEGKARSVEGLEVREGVGYLDFLRLLADARLVLTDSGGVQQESCILRIPCVTLRENTEWTETVQIGANMLAGTHPERVVECVGKMLETEREWENPFGDGKSSVYIVDVVEKKLTED